MKRFTIWAWLAGMSPLWVGVVVGVALLTPAALVEATLYFRGLHAIKTELRNDLAGTAKAASTVIDPSALINFKSQDQESSSEYENAIAPLRKLQEADSRISYVYTYIVIAGDVYFILDPTDAGDSDGDGVDDKSHIMQLYEDSTPAMLATFQEGKAQAEEDLTEDDWGVFISGFAPILDADGEVIGAVGIDLDAKGYALRLAEFKQAALIAGLVALFSSIIIGLAAALFQRRLFIHQDEQKRSREALEDIANNLDRTNERLQLSNKRFAQLFNMIPVPCFTFDAEGNIFEWNHDCERLIGLKAHEVILKSVTETIVGPANKAVFTDILSNAIKGNSTSNHEWSDIGANGKPFTVLVNTFPLVSPTGDVTGGIIACSDITVRQELQRQIGKQMEEIQSAYTELEQSRIDLEHINSALSKANTRLAHLANIDGLTELFNRVYTCEYLECEVKSTRGFEVPTSVMMIDIDFFKRLNDDYGHLTGDSVLKSVAKSLLAATRHTDIVGRYGGEEFIIVLPGTDKASSLDIAERLRESIENLHILDKSVTVSIGVVTSTIETRSSLELIEYADKALYGAKNRGRNCVLHASDFESQDAA